MALSRVTAIGNGVTRNFAVNFALGYLKEADVTCRVGAEVDGTGQPLYRGITWLSPSIASISGPVPAPGVQVLFQRTVNKGALIVDFEDRAVMNESNMNTAQKQAIMIAHEALDYVQDAEMFAGWARISAQESAASAAISNSRAIDAEASRGFASLSAIEAFKWANNPEDVAVVGNSYSAFHWAQKAASGSGIPEGTFTPEQYGAVGDGVADDLPAMQRLFEAVRLNNGGVIIATKNYYMSSQLEIVQVSNWILDGQKRGQFRGPGQADPATGKYSNGHVFRLDRCGGVTIKQLVCTMPRSLYRGTGMCFRILDSQQIKFYDVTTDGGTCGMWFYTCQFCYTEKCIVNTPKADGIHFGQGSSFCKSSECIVLDAGDDSFSTTYYDGFPRPKFISFVANTAVGGVWGAGVAVWGGDNCVVSDNILVDIAGPGVQLSFHQSGGNCNNCVVSGNKLNNCGKLLKQPENYWYGTPVANDPDMSNAQQYKCGMSINAQRTKVDGNSITNNTTTGESGAAIKRYGMYIHGSSLCDITDNHFSNIDGDAIWIESNCIGYITIKGNTFDQIYGTSIKQLAPNQFGNKIVGNTFGFGATRTDAEGANVLLKDLGTFLVQVTGNVAFAGQPWLKVVNSTKVQEFYNSYQDMVPTVSATVGRFDRLILRPGGSPSNGASGELGEFHVGASGRPRYHDSTGQAKFITTSVT